MATDIYELHGKAFRNVSAYVVVGTYSKGAPDLKARVAFKHSEGGRVTCYLHIFGGPMVRGWANGGGYDKWSASASVATSRIVCGDYAPDSKADVVAIVAALRPDDGHHWDARLRDAGYQVFQAV